MEEKKKEYTKEQQDEFMEIYDALMFNGEYSKQLTVSKNTSIVVKTRTGDEVFQVGQALEELRPGTDYLVSSYLSLLNLAFSVSHFRGNDLSDIKPYPDRFNFFKKLPAPVLDILAGKLREFDEKVSEATEYCKENF